MEPFTCPRCKMILILPDHYAGISFRCPNCNNEISVPASTDEKPECEEPEKSEDSLSATPSQRCPGNLRTVLLAASSSPRSWLP